MSGSRSVRWLAVSGLAVLVCCAAAGSASARTYYPDCRYKAVYKPKTIQVGCVAILRQVSKLKWTSWGASKARARGRYTYQTCQPRCVNGRVKRVAARLVLSRKRKCPRTGKNVFTRLTIIAKGEPRTPFKVRCQPL